MKKERENCKLCYIDDISIIDYVQNRIDDIIVELQKTRIARNISLYKLAQMTGLAHTTIMRIENYSQQPSLEALMRIALALGANIDILGCTGTQEVSPSNAAYFACSHTNLEYNEGIETVVIQEQEAEGPTDDQACSNVKPTKLRSTFLEVVQELRQDLTYQMDSFKYIEETEKSLRHYIKTLYKYTVAKSSIHRITEFSNNLILVLREYYLGQHTSAYELFTESMSLLNLSSLYSSLLPEQKLYRARKKGKQTHFNKMDFYHIPFEKRVKVSSQRYSFPGLPCVYMGSSIDVCLLELGGCRNSLAVAELQVVPNKSFYLLDLTGIFNKPAEQMNLAEQNDFFELLPLIYLCSTRINEDVRNDNVPLLTTKDKNYFRPDYIIPQLLLEYMLDKTAWKEKTIIGIQYYSVQEDFYTKWLEGDFDFLDKMKNVVIPVRTNGNEGFCKELASMIDAKILE